MAPPKEKCSLEGGLTLLQMTVLQLNSFKSHPTEDNCDSLLHRLLIPMPTPRSQTRSPLITEPLLFHLFFNIFQVFLTNVFFSKIVILITALEAGDAAQG